MRRIIYARKNRLQKSVARPLMQIYGCRSLHAKSRNKDGFAAAMLPVSGCPACLSCANAPGR
jgi:hypothetical protein